MIYLYGFSWQAATILGLGLALSSTALVMQEIDEKGERRTDYGQTAISVLLFEDLAIVPLLILVALLAPAAGEGGSTLQSIQAVGLAVVAVVALIAFGRYLMEPMFHGIARTGAPELMTAAALGLVIAAGGLMIAVDLSPAMGAFIAGVMLASSTYRHEIEADIEPFRRLFIGLFFMAVGLSLDLGAVFDNWLLILVAVPILMVLKSATIYVVSRAFGSGHVTSLRIAFGMSQHGEFGFVLFSAAASALLIDQQTSTVIVTIVTLSMVLSSQSDRLLAFVLPSGEESIDEDFSDAGGDVLVVGFGRFGQIVSQPLLDAGFGVTLLDKDVRRIREAERFGTRVHFGDGRRREVLEAAGVAEARLVAVCVDNRETCVRIVKVLQAKFPQAIIVARAVDRPHAIDLAAIGVDTFERDTFRLALSLSSMALERLGLTREAAEDFSDKFAERDLDRLTHQITSARPSDPEVEPERLSGSGAADASAGVASGAAE